LEDMFKNKTLMFDISTGFIAERVNFFRTRKFVTRNGVSLLKSGEIMNKILY